MIIRNAPFECRRNRAFECRRNYQLSAVTAESVKEYFDVSVYRNVLDMLNTFEGVLNRWGLDLHDNTINIYSAPSRARYSGAANVGYAIKKVGQSHGWNEIYIYARKQLAKYGLKPLPPTWNTRQTLIQAFERGFTGSQGTQTHYGNIINSYMALKGAYFSVPDLLTLARQINWELNRVRLPIPHNFRQINEKIQGRDYKITPFKTIKWYSDIPETSIEGNLNNYINLMELIDVYGQLKVAINILRVSTRKEIDAANLASKVQEETLRREQEELITRQQAETLAEENRLIILAEKKAALEKELLEAEALKQKLAETRAQLSAELQLLEDKKAAALNEPEVIVIEEKQMQVIDAIEKVDIVEADKNAALETAKQAAVNVDSDLIIAQQELIAKQALKPSIATTQKKSNLLPILLTVAAGVILT